MEKPKILSFNLSVSEKEKLVRFSAKFGAEVKEVSTDSYSLPLAAIASGIEPKVRYSGAVIPEKMLVFVNFPNTSFDVYLDKLKAAAIVTGVLKAVLTATNAVWQPMMLYGELVREREKFLSNKIK